MTRMTILLSPLLCLGCRQTQDVDAEGSASTAPRLGSAEEMPEPALRAELEGSIDLQLYRWDADVATPLDWSEAEEAGRLGGLFVAAVAEDLITGELEYVAQTVLPEPQRGENPYRLVVQTGVIISVIALVR